MVSKLTKLRCTGTVGLDLAVHSVVEGGRGDTRGNKFEVCSLAEDHSKTLNVKFLLRRHQRERGGITMKSHLQMDRCYRADQYS